jgi:hypothetical protein
VSDIGNGTKDEAVFEEKDKTETEEVQERKELKGRREVNNGGTEVRW